MRTTTKHVTALMFVVGVCFGQEKPTPISAQESPSGVAPRWQILPEPTITTAISAELERDFERARADEAESKLWHDADTVRLQAAFAAVQKACPGVQRPERGKPLVCQPVPVKKAVKP